MIAVRPAVLTIMAATLVGCGTPSYVDRGKGETASDIWPNQVTFILHESFRHAPPRCIAVLPLDMTATEQPEHAISVRRVLFGHLAPQGRRSVALARIDHVLARMPEDARTDPRKVGGALNCDAIITGEVTQYSSDFLGLYSRVAVGAKLRMTRAATGEILWEGEHVASSHGGSLPLSPIGVAMGIVDAATNVTDEQRLRVTDDLARRLISTIPDDTFTELDDPAAEPLKLTEARPTLPDDPLAKAEALAATGDYVGALESATQVTKAEPARADAQFLTGRMLLKLDRAQEAEAAMIRAVALDSGNARYLDGLGHVNALAGRPDRALAAYRMAIEVDHADGFAWYNSGVLLLADGQRNQAADAFYGAGLAYLKKREFGMAGKSLTALKELQDRGLDLGKEIDTIETALNALPGVKTS